MRSVPIPRRQQRRAVRWLAQQPGNELSLPAENPGAVQPARIHHLVVGVRWQGQREVCASSILRGHPACARRPRPWHGANQRLSCMDPGLDRRFLTWRLAIAGSHPDFSPGGTAMGKLDLHCTQRTPCAQFQPPATRRLLACVQIPTQAVAQFSYESQTADLRRT
jgi:hypothetical protein